MTTVPPLPVFLYDGDCAFCSSCARFLDQRIPTTASVAAWQHTTIEDLGVSIDEVDVAVVMVTDPSNHSSGPEAIADLLGTSPSRLWRSAGRVLGARLVLLLAWPIYRWISRNRHRMPGGTATCSLPQAERAAAATTPPGDE